jgi:tRNA A-37 threonylcarbamoyl transferase component Bud32
MGILVMDHVTGTPLHKVKLKNNQLIENAGKTISKMHAAPPLG